MTRIRWFVPKLLAGWVAFTAGGAVAADEIVLPEPQSGMLVVPKGCEQKTFRTCGSGLGGSGGGQRMEAGVSWDDQALMVVVNCTDESVVAAQGGGHDNPAAWKDDAVELLLDRGHRHGAPVILRVSAANGSGDSLGTDTGFGVAGLVTRAVQTRTGWRATILAPWKGLGVSAPADGDVWGFNIKRIDHKGAFSLDAMGIDAWLPFRSESQDVMLSGHIAFVTPATLEDDQKLAAMRAAVAAAHANAIREWAGPNEGNVLTLGGEPLAVPCLGGIGSGAPARQATTATLRRDGEGLDLRFDCADADITVAQEGRDNVKLWKDDSVYVWLDLGHTHRADGAMVLVQVSAGGVVHDSRNGDPKWDLPGLVAETARTATGWSAHLKLPWAGLGGAAPADGAVWGVNLARMDQPGKADFARMECSSLAVIPGGDMSALHRWGHLAFGRADAVAAAAVVPAHEARRTAVERRLAGIAAERKLSDERNAARWGTPANPNASAAARKVMKLLADLPQRKDKRLILCQENWSYTGGNAGGYKAYVEKLAEKSGRMIGMIHVSYGNAAKSDSTEPGYKEYLVDANRNAIRHWNAGGLVTVHINPENPVNGKTGADSLKDRERIAEVATPGTEANKNWFRKLDEYAALLTELRDAGVVVLWRPLHEMTFNNCYWYDAGATKDREVYKTIWREMFRYFSEQKKLDNLLWVYSVTMLDGRMNGSVGADEMYPGADCVDIVGFSQYSDDVDITGNVYETLTGLGKPFAFSEFGPGHSAGLKTQDGLNNLDLVRAVREKYPLTTYACYWGSWPGANMAIIDIPGAVELVQHPWTANIDDLNLKEKNNAAK